MTDNGSRAGRGWAIAGAFVGQVGIFAGIGMLSAGAVTAPTAMPVYAAPAPAVASLLPVVAAPGLPQPDTFPYTLSMDGQAGSGTFSGSYPEGQPPLPSYTVRPGQPVSITLGVTIPDALRLASLTVTFAEVGPDVGQPIDQALYHDATQPLAPGPYTFMVDWPGSGSGLQPATKWLVYMSAGSPGMSNGSPIATVTVAP